jgi:uncharacterized membrane protein YbhN (UPF0104 family)
MIPTEVQTAPKPSLLHRLGHFLGPLVALIAFAAAAYVLYLKLGGHGWQQILDAIHNLPPTAIALAIGLTAVNYALLSGYDGLAVWYLRRPLKPLNVMLAAFVGYAMSHNLTWMGGTASRFRLYLAWGLSAVDVVKIFALIGLAFWTGFCLLAGMVFLIDPMPIPEGAHLPLKSTFWLGPILLGGLSLYLAGCVVSRRVPHFRWARLFPPLHLALLQALVASCDLLLQAGIAYTLMPADYTPGYWRFANAYLLGIAAAILSHVPGGAGVLEVVVLELAPHTDSSVPFDEAAVFGSLLMFRFVYFVLPLIVATILFLAHEYHSHRKRSA